MMGRPAPIAITGAFDDADYIVSVCSERHVHIGVTVDGQAVELALDPDDAYDLAAAIMRGYDIATGIA